VFPVTLPDTNKQNVCGGVFFIGIQTADIFEWVLDTLYTHCGPMWKTLMTDEDSALMAAVPAFREKGQDSVRLAPCLPPVPLRRFQKVGVIEYHLNALRPHINLIVWAFNQFRMMILIGFPRKSFTF
jgi:hypothetical protein